MTDPITGAPSPEERHRSRVGEDWSDAEVRATVADYLDMLVAESAGRPYSKAEHRRALLERLDGRSAGAVEFKHANISAAMERLGLEYIKGYKPRGHIQNALIDEITRQTRGGSLLQQPVEPPAATTPAVGARFVGRPERTEPIIERGRGHRLGTPDFGALERENRRLGRIGEAIVFDVEVERLRAEGRLDLAQDVVWVARDLGDGAGYDIASFEADGRDRHIEVKSTRLGPTTPFYLSAWELAYADDHPEVACIYRLYDLDDDPKIYIVRPPYDESLTMEATTYRVWP
jgi:hypothetical protein